MYQLKLGWEHEWDKKIVKTMFNRRYASWAFLSITTEVLRKFSFFISGIFTLLPDIGKGELE